MQNRIRELRKLHNETQNNIAKLLGVSHPMIYKYENNISTVPMEAWEKLSSHWNVPIGYIMGVESSSNDKEGQKKNGNSIDYLKDGSADFTGEYFRAVAKDRTMAPIIHDGDKVICHRQSEVENGEIAVVQVGQSEPMLRIVQKSDEGMALMACNYDLYKPHFYTNAEIKKFPVKIIAKATEVHHRL